MPKPRECSSWCFILEEVISESLTPKQSLLVIQRLFPSRIEVLDTALESAELSKQFRHRRRLFKLLWELANGYWYALGSGRQCLALGDNYAAQESDRCRTIDVRGNEGHLHTKGETPNDEASENRNETWGLRDYQSSF